MATTLRYPMGHTFLDNSGNPLASGTVQYYEAGTTTDEPIYSDAAGLTALPNPITLNSAGRAVDGSSNLVAIYLSDAGGTDYKEVVKSSGGTTIWTDDNIPEPVDPTASLSDTAKPRIQWSTDTDASVSLTAGNLGGGRLADKSSNSITYSPISASTAGNGNGYLIKATNASNTVTFNPDGAETVDGAASFAWTEDDRAYWFVSDGANWQVGWSYLDDINSGDLDATFISALTQMTSFAVGDEFLVQLAGGGALRKATAALVRGTLGSAQATTSGTAFNFTSIPAGVNRITLILNGVSLAGTDDLLVQIGDSGGLETTGYVSASFAVVASPVSATSTAGYVAFAANAARVLSGHMVLTRTSGNIWVSSHSIGSSATTMCAVGGGSKELSAELDRITLTRTGTDAFDAGSVNIFYE